MQDRMNEARSKEGRSFEAMSIDALQQMEDRERELNKYRDQVAMQERELDQYRKRLKEEHFTRDKELQKELEMRERFFSDREKKLFERQKEVEEQLVRRQNETEQLRMRLQHEISQREAQLIETEQMLQLEKARYTEESRKKIESKSKDYVSDALETLQGKEQQFHSMSKVWGSIGALSLVCGVVFFSYVTVTSFSALPTVITWEFITFSAFKGLLAVALLAALSKYSFLFSNSYMREALKNGDRRHAINFGKFYLESYGAAADWTQIKEAFEHWNITSSNAFTKSEDAQIDVTALEKVAVVMEKIGKAVPSLGKNKAE